MKEINLVHPTLKTKIKVFYLDSITDTIDIQLIYSILNQIHSNIKDFSNASIFSDLTIEIYNPNHDKYPSGLSAGLTHPFKNLIQFIGVWISYWEYRNCRFKITFLDNFINR